MIPVEIKNAHLNKRTSTRMGTLWLDRDDAVNSNHFLELEGNVLGVRILDNDTDTRSDGLPNTHFEVRSALAGQDHVVWSRPTRRTASKHLSESPAWLADTAFNFIRRFRLTSAQICFNAPMNIAEPTRTRPSQQASGSPPQQ